MRLEDEAKLLREIASKVIEANECEDLYIDGIYGAARLSEAKELADQWKEKFPTPPLHCGSTKCGVCN